MQPPQGLPITSTQRLYGLKYSMASYETQLEYLSEKQESLNQKLGLLNRKMSDSKAAGTVTAVNTQIYEFEKKNIIDRSINLSSKINSVQESRNSLMERSSLELAAYTSQLDALINSLNAPFPPLDHDCVMLGSGQ